jgi:flavin-binding protein dodecin
VNHTYSISEIVGSSNEGIEQAIDNGLGRMSKTIKNLDWFEVASIRGRLGDDGAVAHYQVTLKVGFRMED